MSYSPGPPSTPNMVTSGSTKASLGLCLSIHLYTGYGRYRAASGVHEQISKTLKSKKAILSSKN